MTIHLSPADARKLGLDETHGRAAGASAPRQRGAGRPGKAKAPKAPFAGSVTITLWGASATIKLPWPPTVNHYWLSTGRRRILSDAGRAYRERVVSILLGSRFHLSRSRLAVSIDCYPADRRKRDIDNLPKGILDSLKHAGVFDDDEQVDSLTIERKPLGAAVAHVVVTVAVLGTK